MSNDQIEYIRLWLEKAKNDLENARIVLSAKESNLPFDTICFHCQQSVEKCLKAILVFHEFPFPKSHNLADLVAMISNVEPEFEKIQRKAEILTPYAVEIRYPDDLYMPDQKEAEEAFAIASEINTLALNYLEKRLS